MAREENRSKGQRIAVTGGAGFIGSNFVKELLKKERLGGREIDKITIIDRLSYATGHSFNNLEPVKESEKISLKKMDISNYEKLISLEKFDVIVNFAAESHVDRSIAKKGPDDIISSNVIGPLNLAEKVLRDNSGLLLHISTDEVYGPAKKKAFTERDRLNPGNLYAASKASADLSILAQVNTHNLPAVITRSSNNYGPYQHPEKLLPRLVMKAFNNEPFPIYGNGKQVRDWLYVSDNIRAIISLIEGFLKGKVKRGEIFNIAGQNLKENIWMAEKILDLIPKSKSKIKHIKDRPGHDIRYEIEDEKIKKTTGWTPQVDLGKGLKKTIDWYKENKEWAKKLFEESEKFYSKN